MRTGKIIEIEPRLHERVKLTARVRGLTQREASQEAFSAWLTRHETTEARKLSRLITTKYVPA